MKIKSILDKGEASENATCNYKSLNYKSNVRYAAINPQEGGGHLKFESFCDNFPTRESIESFLSRELFGQFKGDDDYLLALSIFFASTKETAHRKFF